MANYEQWKDYLRIIGKDNYPGVGSEIGAIASVPASLGITKPETELSEPVVTPMSTEGKQQMESQSIFRNLIPAPKQTKEEELQNLVGKGVQIGTEAGLQFGKSESKEQPQRSLASIINDEQIKKEPTLSEILNFGKNDLASQQALQQAIQERNDRQLIANLGSAFNTISGGLAKTGPVDNSFYDKLGKQAEQYITDYEKQVEFQKQDHNSAYSKGLRDYFKTKLGIDVKGDASAVDLEKIMPFAVREFEAREERAQRKQQQDLDRKQRAADRAEDRKLRETLANAAAGKKEDIVESKAKQKLDTDTRLLRKEIFSGPGAKAYNNYLNSDRAAKSIEQFMKNPTGYSDYATLMGGLKALQGDESVVREAEIRLGMDAGSFQDKVLNRIEKLKSGKSLQPEQRKAVLEAVKILKDITKSQFLQTASPQLTQAERMGIPRDELISNLLDAPENTPAPKQVIKKGYNPKTNQTQLIYSDGSKEIVDGKR